MSAGRFLWLYDQLTEQEMSGMQIAVLFIILARDEAGMRPISKAELGHLIGVTERHAATILKELQHDLSLIQARKGEKAGKGRAPNRYVARPDSIGAPVPDDWITNCKTGTTVPEKKNKTDADAALSVESQSPESGTTVPVICGEVLPPMDRYAPARGEDNLKLLSELELNPDTAERVCGAREMPVGGGDLDMDWALSADDRKFANERGFLNGSCDELFGQFLDHCATKGPRQSTRWRSEWGRWVRNQVKFDAERARRANQTPLKEIDHDQQRTGTSHSYASAGKRRARSVETEILMRDILDDPPRPVGRVDLSAGK